MKDILLGNEACPCKEGLPHTLMLQTYIKLQRRKDIKIIHAACIYTTCLLVQYPVDVLYCIYVTVVANLSRRKL